MSNQISNKKLAKDIAQNQMSNDIKASELVQSLVKGLRVISAFNQYRPV